MQEYREAKAYIESRQHVEITRKDRCNSNMTAEESINNKNFNSLPKNGQMFKCLDSIYGGKRTMKAVQKIAGGI